MDIDYHRPSELEALYIDFDAFFANVEKQLEPDIRALPVGITSLPSDHASLITCCYMAKAAGVKRGMRVFEARELCPNLITRPARHDVYVKMHQKILAEITRHVPVSQVGSIDEMTCLLLGRERQNAPALARQIKEGLSGAIGPHITASIGLSGNGFLAKIAAEMNKPDGLTILRPNDLPGPLFDLALRDIPGISKNMEARLHKAGVETIEELWNISGKQARAIWRSVEGERLWAQLRGYCITRPETKRAMFGHGRRLSGSWRAPDKARSALRLLTSKAAYRLRREGYTAGAMRVSLRGTGGERWRKDSRFSACDDDYRLLRQMGEMFDDICARLPPRIRFEQVAVMLHDIVKTGQRSGDLFNETPDNPKWLMATRSMDKLNEKHGKCVLHLGPRAQLPGGYAGAKIAFGRIPDEKDFF